MYLCFIALATSSLAGSVFITVVLILEMSQLYRRKEEEEKEGKDEKKKEKPPQQQQ